MGCGARLTGKRVPVIQPCVDRTHLPRPLPLLTARFECVRKVALGPLALAPELHSCPTSSVRAPPAVVTGISTTCCCLPPYCCCFYPQGKPVNTLLVARKMQLAREMYFAILLDRKTAGPMMIGCSEVRAGAEGVGGRGTRV